MIKVEAKAKLRLNWEPMREFEPTARYFQVVRSGAAATTAAHRVRPLRHEPGARPNAIPEITNRGVSARPRCQDGRVGGAAS